MAFASERDLVGQNPDGDLEVFLWEADGPVLRQITDTDADSRVISFTADGALLDEEGASVAYLHGDPVTLWGGGLPAELVAEAAGTIAYELFCNLAARVHVRVIDG